MPVHTLTLHEAEGHLKELAELASQGSEVIINLENGNCLKLIVEKPSERQGLFGLYEGKIRISDDFDDELPDSFWFGEEK